ncbi:MAG: trypsin-like peptidase domain-containing protein [Streptosporangiaceae bacterium]|nr:trypsin-like peptidase domain-containing protein [Streptosporangiaceae bacterium]MBV9857781.1 trypsin-like peptidase domain-containing protein [Streptosporangiaceae bacterium]
MSEPFTQYPEPPYPEYQPPRRRRRHVLGLTATAVVALGAGAGIATAALSSSSPPGSATAVSKTVLTTSQIASRVDPGLVDVTSTLGYQQATAKGTGIVLTPNGEVLTNNHVVQGATSVSVTDIGNGKTYKATVVGYDSGKDIAVLQLSGASGLTTASTGDSSAVQTGDGVVALGNAGGVGGTPSVAAGTVTALNQSITASDEGAGTSENLTGLIETNANIQAGDSGGPLVNSYGQVIGVDTAASSGYQLSPFGQGNSSSQPGTTQGFAIPVNTALSIARQIEAGQASSTVHIGETAFLGVQIQNSGSDSSGFGGFGGFGQFGSGDGQSVSGVAIAGAESGSPAANVGLTAGDVITSVAGQPVSTGTSIQSVLGKYHPGDQISIGWTDQDGQSHTTTVTLATGPVG